MRVGFLGLLTLLFIGLKLGGIIEWAWIWVLCPLWIPLAVVAVFVLFCLAMAAISAALDDGQKGR